ncbi:VanW family protein [Amycolatopsis antarctica]|uniref:VanW family protein n=1 Tax=Amycolatopsis antarctica TaxID=1854586 RepID=UPI001F0A4DDB|nr:VanW family protein [Amycolatopsis antarctica]
MTQEHPWPESHAEQTDVLPVVHARRQMPADAQQPPAPGGGEQAEGKGKRSGARKAGIIAGAAVGVLALLYGIDLLVSQGSVPRGVTVAGIDLGGEDRDAAEQRLRDEIEPRLTQPVQVRAGAVEQTLDPRSAGLSLDWSGTLDQAGDQPLSPFTRISSFFTHREVGVVTEAEPNQLKTAMGELRGQLERDPVEGGIRFEEATPIPVDPVQGQKLDVEAATQTVLDHWASGSLNLPVNITPVKTTPEGVRAAFDEVAVPAVAAPVLVKGEGKDVQFEPAEIGRSLVFEPGENGALNSRVDNAKVIEALGPKLKETEIEGKDAEIVFTGGSPTVQPSEDGKAVKWDPSLAPLMDVLKRPDAREIVAQYEMKPAKVTTDAANQLGIKEVIGEFTTKGFAADSGTNIRVVAEKVDGAIVKPGDTFSLNGFTGPRGTAQGYVEAGVISDGAPGREVGGGISQFATTLYNASYFAAMKDAGHKEHSYYISRYPAAREATVFQDGGGNSVIDLKFANDSETGVAIQTIWSPSSITVKLWGTKRYEVESVPGGQTAQTPPQEKDGPAENCKPSEGSPGFTTSDTRVLRDAKSGAEVRREPRTVKYNPQPKIRCPEPAATP